MYANTAKIIFNIMGKRETFFFKNRVLQFLAHPHQQNNQKKKIVDKKNKTKTKKTKKTETVRRSLQSTWSMTACSSPHI
jgi:hypothetical protein